MNGIYRPNWKFSPVLDSSCSLLSCQQRHKNAHVGHCDLSVPTSDFAYKYGMVVF